jgi:DNA-binding FadR family transcriptional regulator
MNKAETIEGKGASSAVRKATHALRAAVFKCGDGELLGSEDDLILRFGVSRPTLRQAAALVAQEQLLAVKRGVGGGYFARRPDSMAVAHMTAIYLQTHDAKLEEIVRAVAPIRVELARLATRNQDPAAKAAVRAFIERERERDQEPFHYKLFLKGEREFSKVLREISGNKVLSLFLEILYDFASMISREADIYVNRPERIEEYRSKRNRMAEAILEGDEEVAVLAARRCTMNVTEWMMEDLNRGFEARSIDDIGASRRKVDAT